MTDMTAARTVGVLFIVTTLAGLASLIVQQPLTEASDYLETMGRNRPAVTASALLELVMALGPVAITIVIHPILKRFSERLALGYVVARLAEGLIVAIDAVLLLTLLTLSETFLGGGGVEPSQFQTLGEILGAQRSWAGHAVLDVAVFPLGALILNYALYRANLVVPWLAVWGLAVAALYWMAGVLVIFGLEPMSTTHVALSVPLAIQEMALAVWLILKGFMASAEPEIEPSLHS